MSLAHLPVASAGQDIRTARHLHLDHGVISSIIGFLEWFAISLGSFGSAFLFQLFFQNYFNDLDVALGVGIMAASFYVLLAAKLGLYQIPNLLDVRRALFKVCSVWASIVGLLILILFMLKVSASFSRGAVSLFAVLGLDVLLCGRLVIMVIARKLIANKVVTGRPAVIIGEASELSHWTASDFMIHFGVVETARVTLFSSDAATHLARLERAIELSQNNRAEEFLVAVRWAQSELLEKVQDCLRNSPLRVRLVPDVLMRTMMKRRSASLIPSIELQRAPLNSLERLMKRSLDIALVLPGLIALAPLLTMTALAIKCDSAGPIIFRQRRNGFNGQQFTIYKFRTMHVTEDGPEIVQARRNDSRVTRVGRILRRTSIDELPQLFNVLLGHMSLIGPRPHALAHDDEFKKLVSNYACRHHVKPGLSGWAQVNGHRGETRADFTISKRVEFDIWYINNWSLGLDVLIIFRTFIALFKDEAY